ncbi:zinc-binding dehydrogenase [Streptomyces cellulosae]|uniref:alcohol dehydrogenase catalytic domain-containing protein n=1 Tax=Streptomyces TaxID=1883 RepID=UPI0013712282|nr:zinc-binding dehydrogenase [Streptomyces cellulosae]MXQ61642.1 alcohol dehydrogenase catalytic domain-containing protein [Streptomyces sp. XHT-2]WTC54444.1 zinc-binding dehydrogenase [Streptomyces cellulosae]
MGGSPPIAPRSTASGDTGTTPLPQAARASVALPGARSELRTFPLRAAGPREGWLRVTASGICGTDVGLFHRGVAAETVLGHHVVGRIAAVGPEAAHRWQVGPGDRVVVEEYLPCGECPRCVSGAYRLCPQTDLWGGGRRIGTVPAGEDPALFGGNAEYMFLPENAVLHRLPERLPEELAAWVLPYANAVDWVLRAGRLAAGENVVVLGPGYHGLAVTAAARLGEAGEVVVVGLPRDAERLGMAEALGATAVTAEESGDWGAAVRAALGGASCDLVVDTSGSDPGVVDVAVDLLGHGGRLVLTTPKQPAAVPADSAAMIRRCLTLTAVRGRPPEAIGRAIASLADGTSGLEHVPTVDIPLDEVGDMLTRLAAGAGPSSPHIVVRPDTPHP